MPVDGILHRSGKDLPIRNILMTVTIFKSATFDTEGQVGFPAHHMHLLSAFEPVTDLLLFGRYLFPISHRIIHIRHAGIIDKILIF